MRFFIFSLLIFITVLGRSQSGSTAVFDGTSNSYIYFGDAKDLNGFDVLQDSNRLSITLWVKWGNKSGVSGHANLFTANLTTSGDAGIWWVQHNYDNTKFEFALKTSTRLYTQSTTNPIEGTWYHLALIYDGTYMKLFVNGIEESHRSQSGNIAAFFDDVKLYMGRWAAAGRVFKGNIDEVSVWNIALTPAQIAVMMSNPEGVTGSGYDTTGLLGYWNFEDETATDLTSNGNDGILGSSVAFPIDLISFTGKFNNNAVVLDWVTASELNNDYFVIERAARDNFMESKWDEITTISGAGTTNILSEYKYIDQEPSVNETVNYYRIKQVDYDGKFSYSNVVSVSTIGSQSIQVYPNPTTGNIRVKGISNTSNASIEIYNAMGQLIRAYSNDNDMYIDISDQPNGMYMVKSGERIIRFVKE